MAESMAVFAPNANSYRRFVSESYAPVAPIWGINNRSVSLRVPAGPPASRHVEHRIAGADANLYLAVATVLAARRAWTARTAGSRRAGRRQWLRAAGRAHAARAPGTRRSTRAATIGVPRRDARQGIPRRSSSPSSTRNARASRPRSASSTTPGTCAPDPARSRDAASQIRRERLTCAHETQAVAMAVARRG